MAKKNPYEWHDEEFDKVFGKGKGPSFLDTEEGLEPIGMDDMPSIPGLSRESELFNKRIGSRMGSGFGKGNILVDDRPECDYHSSHPPTVVLRSGDDWGLSVCSWPTVRENMKDFDLLVNCTGSSLFHSSTHIIPPKLTTLQQYSHAPKHKQEQDKEIVIDWPNMGTPYDLPFQFWLDLYQVITQTPKTLLFCQGGHGRTGTALGILLIASGALKDKKKSISWVRENYCRRAIESSKQEDMIKEFAKWMK